MDIAFRPLAVTVYWVPSSASTAFTWPSVTKRRELIAVVFRSDFAS